MRKIVALLLITVISIVVVTSYKCERINADVVHMYDINNESVITNATEIKLNEEVESWAGLSHKETYVFVPEVSGRYAFSVKTDSGLVQQATVNLTIYDKEYNKIASSEGWSNYETAICNMTAGEYYYLHYDSYAYDVLGEAVSKVFRIGNITNENEFGIDTTDELMQVGEVMTLEDVTEIKLNDKKNVAITFFDAKSVHKFTPVEDGDYKFTASGNDDIIFCIFDESFNRISSGKVPYIKNLKAGKTYVISSYIADYVECKLGEYSIGISKLPKAEKMQFVNGEKIIGNIGDSELLSVVYTPTECEAFELEWSSSDKSVVEVDAGRIYLNKIGAATITVSGENGLSASIEVEVVHHPELKVGEIKTVEADEDKTILTFIPEKSGKYIFSAEVEDTEAILRGNVQKLYSKADGEFTGKQSLNMEYDFVAGEVYYITVEILSNEKLGSVDVLINMAKTPYEIGDVNLDEQVNAEDALLVLKHAAKIEVLPDDIVTQADLNKDNAIDAEDALEVLKIAAKITE